MFHSSASSNFKEHPTECWDHDKRTWEWGSLQVLRNGWKWWDPTCKDERKDQKRVPQKNQVCFKSKLNSAIKMNASNTLPVSVAAYSFSIISWRMADIDWLDRKARNLLTIHRMDHPKADLHGIYLPHNRGRGICNSLHPTKHRQYDLKYILWKRKIGLRWQFTKMKRKICPHDCKRSWIK